MKDIIIVTHRGLIWDLFCDEDVRFIVVEADNQEDKKEYDMDVLINPEDKTTYPTDYVYRVQSPDDPKDEEFIKAVKEAADRYVSLGKV